MEVGASWRARETTRGAWIARSVVPDTTTHGLASDESGRECEWAGRVESRVRDWLYDPVRFRWFPASILISLVVRMGLSHSPGRGSIPRWGNYLLPVSLSDYLLRTPSPHDTIPVGLQRRGRKNFLAFARSDGEGGADSLVSTLPQVSYTADARTTVLETAAARAGPVELAKSIPLLPQTVIPQRIHI